MHGRSHIPVARGFTLSRSLHQIHRHGRVAMDDWPRAHRAALMQARCGQAQERAIRLARGRWRQC